MSEPLTHARIGWDSITRRGSIIASSEIEGFPALAAANELTYSYWSAGLPATWEVALPTPEVCNYLGIAAHDLKSKKTTAVVQAFIDGAWRTMPAQTLVGDLFRYNGSLDGERFTHHGATEATLRRGFGDDLHPIRSNLSEAPETLGGSHALTVEPETENLLPSDVRNASSLTGTTGDRTLDTTNKVSGASSFFVNGGSPSVLDTDPVPCDTDETYWAQVKVRSPEGEANLSLQLFDDDLGPLGSQQTLAIDAGSWAILTVVGVTGAAATEINLHFESDVAVYVDELQIAKQVRATTWADGLRNEGTLTYPGELLQPFKACTINMWVRMPGLNPLFDVTILRAKTNGFFGAVNSVWLRRPASSNSLEFETSAADGSSTVLTYSSNPWTGQWRMLTVVVVQTPDGDTKWIYLDGVLVASERGEVPTWAEINSINVGHDDGSEFLGGSDDSCIDDLLVYNRAATAAEIAGWHAAWVASGEAMTLLTSPLPPDGDDRPIMMLLEEMDQFEAFSLKALRFRVVFVGNQALKVGVIYLGRALEMQREMYGGHTPISLNRSTVVRPNISERGQFLGRSIVRSGASGSWSWKNLKADWVRRYLDPFIAAARLRPFFILWRPQTFPSEAGYCWTTGDVAAPSNSGGRDFMTFTLDAQGLGHE